MHYYDLNMFRYYVFKKLSEHGALRNLLIASAALIIFNEEDWGRKVEALAFLNYSSYLYLSATII